MSTILPQLNNPFSHDDANKNQESWQEVESCLPAASTDAPASFLDSSEEKKLVPKLFYYPSPSEDSSSQSPLTPWYKTCGCTKTDGTKGKRRYCERASVCPRCAERDQAHYGSRLLNLLEQGPAVFVTHTLKASNPHSLTQSISELREARKKFGENKFTKFKRDNGILGYLRRWETTIGPSGWNPHFHEIFHLDPSYTPGDAAAVGALINDRFVQSARRLEFTTNHDSQDSQVVGDTADDRQSASFYVAGSAFIKSRHYKIDDNGNPRFTIGNLWDASQPLEALEADLSTQEGFDGSRGPLGDLLSVEEAQELYQGLDAATTKPNTSLMTFRTSDYWDATYSGYYAENSHDFDRF